jgi:hypothetical protein
VAQLAQGLGFDLADALAGDVELFADFLQRVVSGHFDAKAHAQHLGFAGREGVEDVLDDAAHRSVQGCVRWGQGVVVFDEVAQMGVVIVANRRFHRDRLFGDLHDFADFIFRHFHFDRQRGRVWLGAGFLQDFGARCGSSC